MVRNPRQGAYVSPFKRCAGGLACEKKVIQQTAESGVPLDISREQYPKCRAWLVTHEADLLNQGKTIRAGWVRDNITEHDRRYTYREETDVD